MTVEIDRLIISPDHPAEPELLGEMEPGGRNIGVVDYRRNGLQAGYVLAHDKDEARLYRLTPGSFRVVWTSPSILQILIDEATTADFPMEHVATLSARRPLKNITVRQEDGQRAIYRFRYR